MAWDLTTTLTSRRAPAEAALTSSAARVAPAEAAPPPSSQLRRVCLVAARVVAWTVIGVMAAALAAAVLVPRLAGGTPYTILTGSMRPGLPPGTLVVTRPVAADDVQVGTVVTYQLRSGDPVVVTHRVVAVGRDGQGARIFRTQGDANPQPDPAWVRPIQLRGALWYHVPWLGHPSTALSGSQRQHLSVGFAVGLFGYAATMVLGAVRDRRRQAASAVGSRGR